ncbi:hypothetical protein M8494_23535 [Serratia ureilytica]
MLTLTVLMAEIYPWNQHRPERGSRSLRSSSNLGISSAANVLNVVVITAAISAIISDIFGAGRMMYGMAQDGQAPRSFYQTDRQRRAVDDGAGDVGRPAAGGGAQPPDPGEGLRSIIASIATLPPSGCVADDPAVADRHAPHAVAGRNSSVELPVPWWPVAPVLATAFMAFVIGLLGYFGESRMRCTSGWCGSLTHRGLLAVGAQRRRGSPVTAATQQM